MRADEVLGRAGGIVRLGDEGRAGARRTRLAASAERGAWFAFTALLVLAPFRAHVVLAERPVPPVYHAYTDVAVAWSEVMLAAMLIAWAVAITLRPRRLDLGPTLVRRPWLAVVVLGWLTAPLAVDPVLAASNALGITLASGLALYALNEVRRLDRLVPALAAALAVQAVVAVGQVTTQASIGLGWLGEHLVTPATAGASVVAAPDGTRFLRGYGLADHPNILGGLIAAASLVVAFAGRRVGAALGAILVLSGVAILLTFSRGAWLAVLAGALVGSVVLFASVERARLRRLVVVAAVCAAVVAAVALPLANVLSTRLDPGRPDVALEARSIDERAALATLAARVVTDRPLGVGAGMLPIAMRAADHEFAYPYQPAHFVLLTVAAELGVAGAVAYLAGLLAPVILLATRRVRPTSELAAASAALVALTVVGFVDYYTWTFPAGQIWWWLTLGLWVLAWRNAPRRVLHRVSRDALSREDGVR